MVESLHGVLEVVQLLTARAKARPVDYIPWLPPQIAFLSHPLSDRRPSLLRLGNRQGKTTAGAAELIFACRGIHPFKELTKKAPVRAALVTMNMGQSIEIQRVVWELLGKEKSDELVPGTEFRSRTGFRGHRPVIEFRNGSSITIYSNAQGAGTLAGSEYDIIMLDEPPSQEIYDEALARVRNTSGRLILTMTPINGPPLPWLKDLTKEKEDGTPAGVVDYHYKLTEENCISPLTGLLRTTTAGDPWDEKFIRALEQQVDPITADIRLHGAWERAYEGQYFSSWDPATHLTEQIPGAYERLFLGIDYASSVREDGKTAVLVGEAIIERDGKDIDVWVALDEVVVRGSDTIDMFARDVVRMLKRRGLDWSDLDEVHGDRPVSSRWGAAGNKQMVLEVSKLLRVSRHGLLPRIQSAKKGAGSSGPGRYVYDHRLQWLYQAIHKNQILVHPRCEKLAASFLSFDGSAKHPAKDVQDAFAYALLPVWTIDTRYGTLPEIIIG